MAAAAAGAAAAGAVSAAISDSIPPPIVFKEGTDFGVWKAKVIALVKAKKWRQSFQGPPLGIAPPAPVAGAPVVPLAPIDPAEAARRQENLDRFNAFLLNSIDEKVETLFRDQIIADNPEALFNAMCNHYESNDINSKIAIQNELLSLKLAEGGDIEAHIATFKKHVGRLTALGENLGTSEALTKFINSLPRSFEVLTTALVVQDNITLDVLITKVRNYVKQLSTRRLTESAHFTASKDISRRAVGRPTDRPDERKQDTDQTKDSDSQRRSDAKCFRCGEKHYTRDCKYTGKCGHCKKIGHKALLCRSRILQEYEKQEKQENKETMEKSAFVSESNEDTNEEYPQVESNF